MMAERRFAFLRWRNNLCFVDAAIAMMLNSCAYRKCVVALSKHDIEQTSVVYAVRSLLDCGFDKAVAQLYDDETKPNNEWESSCFGILQRVCENALSLHKGLYVDYVRLLGTPLTVFPAMFRANCNSLTNIEAVRCVISRSKWECSQTDCHRPIPLATADDNTLSCSYDISSSSKPWISNTYDVVPPRLVLCKQAVCPHPPTKSRSICNGFLLCEIRFDQFPDLILVEYKRICDGNQAHQPAKRVTAISTNGIRASYVLCAVVMWMDRYVGNAHFYTVILDKNTNLSWVIDDMEEPGSRVQMRSDDDWTLPGHATTTVTVHAAAAAAATTSAYNAKSFLFHTLLYEREDKKKM